MKNYLLPFMLILAVGLNAQQVLLDPTFGINGTTMTDFGWLDFSRSIAIQADGKIVVGGESGYFNGFTLVRYNYNGILDTTFGSGGKVTSYLGGNDGVYSLAIQSDGKIVAAGSINETDQDFVVTRYNNNGRLDSTFDVDGIATIDFGSTFDYCYSIAIQNDGKILAAGVRFHGNGSNANFALARLNTNGSLDNTFGTGGIDTTGGIGAGYSVVIQSDGKIVVAGGGFTILRYNANGTLDNSFTGGNVILPLGCGRSVAIQSDGKIVVAGYSYNGTDNDFTIVRYNNTGSLDSTFGSDGIIVTDFENGSDDQAYSLLIQNNNKIVAAGYGGSGNGDFALARYNSNGTLDPTFDNDGKVKTHVAVYGSSIYAMAIQLDKKIVVAGYAAGTSDSDFAIARYISDEANNIQEKNELTDVMVYPNPTSGTFKIIFNERNIERKICIYDILGNCVIKMNESISESQRIDFNHQSKGIYFIEIVSDDERTVKKIVIE